MADYQPTRYTNGQILKASDMNNVDDGIQQALALGQSALTASSGVSLNPQSLNEAQKNNARANIGAAKIVIEGTTLKIL
jgi:hypothetical protein